MSLVGSGSGDSLEKGKIYGSGKNRWRFLGYDENGQEKYEGVKTNLTKMRRSKKKPKTNYKSTRSKKGKPKK